MKFKVGDKIRIKDHNGTFSELRGKDATIVGIEGNDWGGYFLWFNAPTVPSGGLLAIYPGCWHFAGDKNYLDQRIELFSPELNLDDDFICLD